MVAAIASTLEHEVSQWTAEESQTAPPKTERPNGCSRSIGDPASGSHVVVWPMAAAAGEGDGIWPRRACGQGAAALIDAFLAKGDVKIGPVRDALESTEDWAKQGLVEDPSLVTETMAKLYAQQGQMGRARKSLQAVGFEIPGKKCLFCGPAQKAAQHLNLRP